MLEHNSNINLISFLQVGVIRPVVVISILISVIIVNLVVVF